MLPSRPSSTTNMNVFGEVQTPQKSLGSSSTSSKGQTPRFHTLWSVQGIEAKLDEHKRVIIMFQHVAKYNVHMTNILLKLFDLEIKNKHIIEEKDKFVQNLQGTLEEQKLKARLQDRNNDNSQVLAEFQTTRHKINNMEKQNKDLENIKIERDSLQVTLKGTNSNYQGFKI